MSAHGPGCSAPNCTAPECSGAHCASCGEPLVLNVPRLGPIGGYVHAKTGAPLCEPPHENVPVCMHGCLRRSCGRCDQADLIEAMQALMVCAATDLEALAEWDGVGKTRILEIAKKLREGANG